MAVYNINQQRQITNTTTEYLVDHEVERAVVYMHDNTTETVITATDTPVEVQGTFEYVVNDGFSINTNSVTYSGESMTAQAIAIFSVESSNAQDLALYITRNGAVLGDSEGFVTTDSGGKATNVVCQTIIDLNNGDEISVAVENYTSTHNVTVDNLSMNVISIH
jgi:hypothetical protein